MNAQINKKGRPAAALDAGKFKALSDAVRCSLVSELSCCGRTLTVSQAAKCCPVDLSVVSRHLASLKAAGLVEAVKEGREVHYRLKARELAAWLRSLAGQLESCAAAGAEGRR